MPRGPTPRQSDIDRVLKALAARGLAAAKIEVRPGGGVVITPGPAPAAGAQPALTAPAAGTQPAGLDEWRARKHGRGAPERA